MSLATQALDAQADLLSFLATSLGVRQSATFAESQFEKYPPAMQAMTTPRDLGQTIYTGQRYCVRHAASYAVTREIMDVIESASMVLPTDTTIAPSDLPTTYGFVLLERPITLTDFRGNTTDISAFGWGMVRGDEELKHVEMPDPDYDGEYLDGVVVFAFGDKDGPNDDLVDQLRAQGASEAQIAQIPRLSLYHWQTYAFNEPYDWTAVVNTTNVDGPAQMSDSLTPFLFTFWRFLGEKWVDDRMILPDRPGFKRAKRAKIEPVVRVVRLRAKEVRVADRDEGDDAAVEWSHRWIVEGHWRNQWYPSLQAHRPKYIPSYIKGPEDKPLVVKDRVFSVDR